MNSIIRWIGNNLSEMAIALLGLASSAVAIFSLTTWNSAAGLSGFFSILTFYAYLVHAVATQKKSLSKARENHHYTIERIDLLESSLKKEIDENENLLAYISKLIGQGTIDSELQSIVRKVATSYSVITTACDPRIANYAKRTISELGEALERREYSIDWDSITEYPGPFYGETRSTIDATNIGAYGTGFTSIEKGGNLVAMSKEARKRGVTIRRVFAVNKEEITPDLVELAKKFKDIGVKTFLIDIEKAHRVAEEHRTEAVFRLEDFTLFDASEATHSYSGRILELGANRKRMLITSNSKINDGLSQQFEALIGEAVSWPQ